MSDGIELRVVGQRASRGERVRAAGPDGEDPVVRLDQLAGAGDDEPVVLVGDDQHRLEAAEDAVTAPILGELHRGARQIPGIALELLLELLEQRHGVGRGSREAGDHLAAVEHAHLLCVRLHDRLANRHLAVAADRDLPSPPHGQNRRGADGGERSAFLVRHIR